ncbi:MAG: PAS domain S-box protein [Candidatus Aenigmatarchaeota archaeon]
MGKEEVKGSHPLDPLGKGALQLIESMDEWILVTDTDGRVLKVNEGFEEMTGYSEEEVRDEDVADVYKELMEEGYQERAMKIMGEKALEGNSNKAVTVPIKSKDGEKKYVNLKSSSIDSEEGKLLNVVIGRDITEVEELERTLEKNRKKYRRFLELCPDGICIHQNGRLQYLNPSGAKMLGIDVDNREEHIGDSIMKVVHPDHRDTVKKRISKMVEEGQEVPLAEEKFVRIDNHEPIEVEVAAAPVKLDGKTSIQVVFRDITERKSAENLQEKREEKVKALYQATIKFERCRSEEEVFEVTLEAAKDILGFRSSSIKIMEDGDLVVKAANAENVKVGDIFPADEGIRGLTYQNKRSYLLEDLSEWEEAQPSDPDFRSTISVPIKDEGVFQAMSYERGYFDEFDLEMAETLISHMVQVLERLRYQEKLRRSKQRFETLISKAQEGIYIRDIDGTITYVNEKFAEIHGYEKDELIGMKSRELLHPDSKEELDSRGGYGEEPIELEERKEIKIMRKDGTTRDLLNITSAIETVKEKKEVFGLVHDITERKEREEELQRKEKHFRLLGKNAPAIIYLCRYEKRWPMIYTNDAVEDITGYPKDSFLKDEISFYELYHPEDHDNVYSEVDKALDENNPFHLIYRIIDADGEIRWLEEYGDAVRKDGEIENLVGIVFDITQRKKREERIEHLNSLLRSIREINQLITKEDDLSELMKESREVLMKMRGYLDVSILITDKEEDISKRVGNMRIKDLESRIEEIKKTERVIKTKEEDHTNIFTPMIDKQIEGILAVKVDKEMDEEELGLIKEVAGDLAMAKNKIEAEEKLKSSLKEKEVLLDEIHHRVKNNLQVISSMLSLQASKEEDKKTVRVLQEGQNRIQSMALIHEMLHRSEDVANIHLSKYINELVRSIYQAYDVNYEEVQLEKDMEDIELSIDQATPCIQVINEIVSNSLKHAFPEDHEGQKKLNISTSLHDDSEVEIIVGDNGIGVPEDVTLEDPRSFGFRLIRMLVEDRLDGEVELKREDGTIFEIRFEKESENDG